MSHSTPPRWTTRNSTTPFSLARQELVRALAAIIAQEMAAGFHEVLGQSIKDVADLNTLLLAAKNKDVIHIDEAHELAKELQIALYLAVDRNDLSSKAASRR